MTDQSTVQDRVASSTATGVFVLMRPSQGVTREQIMAVMPDEIRETVKLYLGGKILQWFAREDGRGVILLLNTNDVAEAEAMIEALPLGKQHLVDHEYIAVGPLAALRLLIGDTAANR